MSTTVDARATLEQMLHDESRRLFRRGLSLGLRHHDAEELASSVTVRALAAVSSVRRSDEGSLCSWVDTIARNVAVDLQRQASRLQALDGIEEPASDGPEDAVCMREDMRRVLRGVESISETLADTLVLRVIDELPTREIAERLGISDAAVRQRLTRARAALEAVGSDLLRSA